MSLSSIIAQRSTIYYCIVLYYLFYTISLDSIYLYMHLLSAHTFALVTSHTRERVPGLLRYLLMHGVDLRPTTVTKCQGRMSACSQQPEEDKRKVTLSVQTMDGAGGSTHTGSLARLTLPQPHPHPPFPALAAIVLCPDFLAQSMIELALR